MAKKSSKRRWIWIGAILLVLLLIGSGIWNARRVKPIEVTFEKVERRDLTALVSASGKVQPQVSVKISSEVSGEIIALPVVEGQTVRKGDLLVRIRPDTYEAQVRQREAALAGSKARSLQRQAELLQVELDLRRLEDLEKQGFATTAQMDSARTTVEVQRAALQAARHEIEQQEMLLAEAREELAKTTLYAPMDGTISKLDVEPGERVVGTAQYAGTEMMSVADLTNMEVTIEVSESDITQVSVGDVARITVDALRDEEFSGSVTEIGSSAIVKQQQTREEVTNFEVRVRIDRLDPRIKPGMTASVDIETDTVSGVLAVSMQCVVVRERDKEGKGPGAASPEAKNGEEKKPVEPKTAKEKRERRENLRRVVFVREGDTVKLREVQTGIADTKHLEIKSGLEEGETIVSGSYTALTRQLEDGSKVAEKKSPPKKGGPPKP